ncbi:hypothetical protein Tco_0753118, partial [Tanacetum coccineum]
VEEEQNQPEVMQELLLKLMNDLQILKGIQPKQAEQEEQAAKSFTSYGNFSMIDEFSRIPFGEIPKSSVENLVPIPSEFKGISEDICDVPSCDYFDAECGLINSLRSPDILITSSKIDFLPEEFTGELDLIDPILLGIDENDCVEDKILCKKLLNVNLLIDKIEALNLIPSIPFVLKYPSSYPIAVVDSDFLIEEVDRFLVSEDSIPPGIESDFDLEGDIIFSNVLLNDDPIPKYERFTFDIEPDAPVINNFDELNEDECFDLRGGEIDVSIEDDDSFAFVIRTFLPYLTYPVDSPFLFSTGSEDTILTPGLSISVGGIYWDDTCMCFMVYPNINESQQLEIFFPFAFPMDT